MARRTGEQYEALPRILNGTDDFAKNWRHAFIGQAWEGIGSRSKAKVLKNIESKMSAWGDGSRAIIKVIWKGGKSGHVFSAERVNGKTVFVDPQTGKVVDIMSYVNASQPTRFEISRVDNLQPDPYWLPQAARKA